MSNCMPKNEVDNTDKFLETQITKTKSRRNRKRDRKSEQSYNK